MARLYILVVIMGIFWATGCTTVPRKSKGSASDTASFIKACQDNDIVWSWDGVTQIITLGWGNAQAKVLVGSPVVWLGEQTLILDVPIQIHRSVIIIPADFKSKVIDYLKTERSFVSTYALAKIRRIVVDAGHGGKDPGAIGVSGLQEKEVVLDIAQRLVQALAQYGIKILMTRETDEFISLQERAQMTSRLKADLFVSIHANAHPSRGVHGLEVFSLRPLDIFEMNDTPRQASYDALLSQLAVEKNNVAARQILSDMLFVSKQAESKLLADKIAQKASSDIAAKNLGHKHAGFYVLKNTFIPSVLVEVGFLTNVREEQLLKTSAYREKIAKSIADAIVEYAK